MYGEIEGTMDSGLEERILPSIRRSQMLLIYRKGGVDNPETCCQVACAVEVIRRMETRGQDPCEVGRPRKNKTLGQIACAARLSEGWRPYGQDPCEVGRPRKNKMGAPTTFVCH